MRVLPLLLVVGGALLWWAHRTGRIRLRQGPLLWSGVVFAAVFMFTGGGPASLVVAVGLATMLLGRSEIPWLRAWADRIFSVLFAMFAAAAVVWLVAGILPFVARSVPAVEQSFVRWGGGVEIAEVSTVGQGSDRDAMAFRPAGLSLRADAEVTVIVRNDHVGVPHNLSLYEPETGELVHRGTIVDGPEEEGRSIRARDTFRSPDSGTYELVCDLHPWMRGKVKVSEGPNGPGAVPVIGDIIRRATTAELRTAFAEIGRSPSPGVIGLQYAFSIVNVALGVFLVLLRPRDIVARMLALGMVGTGAVFNAEAHTAIAVVPWLETVHWSGFHGVAGMTYLFAIVLFPDGRLKPSWSDLPRWRWPLRGAFLAIAFFAGAFIVLGTHGQDPVEYIGVFGVLIPVVGLVAQVGKFRHAEDEVERRQSRLLATTLVAAFAGAVTYGVLTAALAAGSGDVDVAGLRTFTVHAFPMLFGAIPVILFVILVRFRLWDIDRIINRAFVYGGLAGFIGVAYVGIVVLGSEFVTQGRNDLWLSVLATAVVAIGFQPLHDRLRGVANRLVYGQRETPYEVLAQFSGRVAETYAGDDVLRRMARMVAEGISAARAEVWLAVGGELVRSATWPAADDGGDPAAIDRVPLPSDGVPRIPDADLSAPVRLEGELLGVLTATAQRDEPLTPVEQRLLNDLASQAGLVLRNIRLTEQLRERLRQVSRQSEELRVSRQRIVNAQDAERRRMERDIHDGAQQHLVALAVKLRLARSVAEREPERARPMLDELREEVDEALETLRNLARGIYPAVLADQGVVAAVRSAAERSPLGVRVVDLGVRRYPEDVETAIYFCCLEALQNATKYSQASVVTVELAERDGTLAFEVRDDGVGFDPSSGGHGRGLQNLVDRVASLDGTVTVDSRPGAGTTVRGAVPFAALEAVR